MDIYKKEPKTGKEAYKKWQSRIVTARKDLNSRERNSPADWAKYYRQYQGMITGGSKDLLEGLKQVRRQAELADDSVTVNVTQSIVQDMLPFLLAKNPKFIGDPTRPSDVRSAKLQGELLTRKWRLHGMQKQLRRATMDSILIGHGWLRNGYRFKLDKAVDPKKKLSYEDYIKKDEPFIERVRPERMLLDPHSSGADLETARWAAQIFVRPLSDVVENEKYSRRLRTDIKMGRKNPVVISGLEDRHSGQMELEFTDRQHKFYKEKMCVLFEVWDRKFMKRLVFVDGLVSPLREDSWPYPYLEELPFTLLNYIEVPDDPFGMGLPELIRAQQKELNAIRTTIFRERRRSVRKYIAREGQIEPEQVAMFESNRDVDPQIIWAKHERALKPISEPDIAADNFAAAQVIQSDLQDLSGRSALLAGQDLPSRTSAKEVDVRQQLFGKKIDGRVQSLDNAVLRTAHQVLAHIKANTHRKEVVRIVGPEGAEWETFSPEDIQAKVGLELKSTADDPTSPAVRRQQALKVLELTLQNLEILVNQGHQPDVGALFRQVFETFESFDVFEIFPTLYNTALEGLSSEDVRGRRGQGVSPVSSAEVEPQATQERSEAQEGSPTNQLLGSLLGGR